MLMCQVIHSSIGWAFVRLCLFDLTDYSAVCGILLFSSHARSITPRRKKRFGVLSMLQTLQPLHLVSTRDLARQINSPSPTSLPRMIHMLKCTPFAQTSQTTCRYHSMSHVPLLYPGSRLARGQKGDTRTLGQINRNQMATSSIASGLVLKPVVTSSTMAVQSLLRATACSFMLSKACVPTYLHRDGISRTSKATPMTVYLQSKWNSKLWILMVAMDLALAES